jgi:hypothetical protein
MVVAWNNSLFAITVSFWGPCHCSLMNGWMGGLMDRWMIARRNFGYK